MSQAWVEKARYAFRRDPLTDRSNLPAITRVTTALRKEAHRFIPSDDSRFRFEGAWQRGGGGVMIAKTPASRVTWTGPVNGAVPVLVCHPFSGVLRVTAPGHAGIVDNYSWFTFLRAYPLAPTLTDGPLDITAIGRNPLAQGQEIVLAGIWLPAEAPSVPSPNPAAFEALQAQMVDNWMDNIRRGGGSVEEVTRQRHGAEAALQAQADAATLVSGASGSGAADAEVPEASQAVVNFPAKAYYLLSAVGICASSSEARRQIQGGGVKLDGEKLADPNHEFADAAALQGKVLQLGKKTFRRLVTG